MGIVPPSGRGQRLPDHSLSAAVRDSLRNHPGFSAIPHRVDHIGDLVRRRDIRLLHSFLFHSQRQPGIHPADFALDFIGNIDGVTGAGSCYGCHSGGVIGDFGMAYGVQKGKKLGR